MNSDIDVMLLPCGLIDGVFVWSETDLSVVIDPSSSLWSSFQNGELTLQRLDYNNIRIINSCLAQTVNLQYFEAQVLYSTASYHSLTLFMTLCWRAGGCDA